MRTGLLITHRHRKGNALAGQRETLQRRSAECFGGVVNREGSDEVLRGFQLDQGPVRRNVRMRSHRDQGRGTIGMDFHIKPIQREIQAHTFALQQSLLAGPAAIKAGQPQRRGKTIEDEQLLWREMMRGDVGIDGSNPFDVDSKRVVAADGKRCEVGAMSQIEVDRLRTGSQVKLRLAIGKRGEVDLGGVDADYTGSRGFACSHGRKRNDRGRGERRSAVLWQFPRR